MGEQIKALMMNAKQMTTKMTCLIKKTVIGQRKTLLYKGTKEECGGGYLLGTGQQSQIS